MVVVVMVGETGCEGCQRIGSPEGTPGGRIYNLSYNNTINILVRPCLCELRTQATNQPPSLVRIFRNSSQTCSISRFELFINYLCKEKLNKRFQP